MVFAQNHDQVGNRPRGERLGRLVSLEKLKLAAGAVLLAPYLPLVFMGEEYGEIAPFPYFISHGDPQLVAAVRRGRQEEFAAFAWQGEIPDPQAETTFLAAKLDPALRRQGMHRILFALYRQLLRLRRELPALRDLRREGVEVKALDEERVLVLRRGGGAGQGLCIFNFGEERRTVALPLCHLPCRRLLDSALPEWGGAGSPAPAELPAGSGGTLVTIAPWSFVLYGN